jgi:hypothetical protein
MEGGKKRVGGDVVPNGKAAKSNHCGTLNEANHSATNSRTSSTLIDCSARVEDTDRTGLVPERFLTASQEAVSFDQAYWSNANA